MENKKEPELKWFSDWKSTYNLHGEKSYTLNVPNAGDRGLLVSFQEDEENSEKLKNLWSVAESALYELSTLEKAKDNAYWERDQLLAALSKLLPSWLARHPDEDKEWEDDWRNIVVVAGITSDFQIIQMTWHIHDSELPNFSHLKLDTTFKWDGHTTEEKYKRLSRLLPKGGVFQKLQEIAEK